MATFRDWQKAVVAQLKTVFPEDQVWEGSVPQESQLAKFDNDMVKPYVVVWFGQRVNGGPGFNSTCGVRSSAHMTTFIVRVAAPTGEMVNDAAALVSDALFGFRPLNQGELQEDGAPTIRDPLEMSGVNPRYFFPIAYRATVDL